MSNSEVFNEDCMQVMARYPDKYFDLAVVDPPYGIGITGTVGGDGPFGGKRQERERDGAAPRENRRREIIKPKSYNSFDDTAAPPPEYFDELKRVSKNQIIWGGNYFINNLDSTPCVIVWDKARRGLAFADCEIAWTSFKSPARIFNFKWNGMLQGDMKNKETRIHPTQKPVALYEWLLLNYAKPGNKILDTHMGSQSSRIAAYRVGMDYVGAEISPEFFKLGNERFERETAQGNLFT